jgi:hypothetical protein
MGQSFLYRMPAGIPGDINRVQAAVVTPEVITAAGQSNAPLAYGLASFIDATSGKVRTVAAGDTFTHGFLARPFPTNSSQDGIGTSTPPASGGCDLMRRGFMTVLLGGSTASVNGGKVYVWIAANSGAHVQGQVEAADPSGNGFAVTGAYFTGGADASGNVEIAFIP